MRKVILCSDVELEASAAIALLADAPDIQVLGIVASAGRVTADTAANNACRVLGCLQKDIPVVKGIGTPLVADLYEMRKAWELPPEWWPQYGPIPDEICGQVGDKIPSSSGVLWIIETLMQTNEKVTLLLLGPMTDLALALKIQPEIADNIEQLIIVGGGHKFTDISAAAEFNIRYDPEAAAIVMGCNIPKYLIPLDCAHSVKIPESVIDEVCQDTAVGAFFKLLVKPLYRRMEQLSVDGIPLPLLLGAAFLYDFTVLPDVIDYSVDVDFSGGYADGQTIFDTRRIFDDYNCMTTFAADRIAFLNVLHMLSSVR